MAKVTIELLESELQPSDNFLRVSEPAKANCQVWFVDEDGGSRLHSVHVIGDEVSLKIKDDTKPEKDVNKVVRSKSAKKG